MGGVYRYIMHVKASAGEKNIKHVLTTAKNALVTGAQSDNGKVVLVYKILGENELVVVIEGGIEGALDQLNKSVGGSVEVVTKPQRAYENFAKSVLKVDESLCAITADTLPTSNRQLFWIHFIVEYKGLTQEQLLSSWKNEAEFALGGRMAGKLDVLLYKGIGERMVDVFLSMPDGDAMDDAFFSLPIVKEMGDNLSVVFRAIIPF